MLVLQPYTNLIDISIPIYVFAFQFLIFKECWKEICFLMKNKCNNIE